MWVMNPELAFKALLCSFVSVILHLALLLTVFAYR